MTFSKFIHLVLPPLFFKAKRKMCAKPEARITPMPKLEKESNTMVVIGNGPSLKESLKKYGEKIKKYDSIVVNYFAATDEYVALKPKYYAFADPMWFGGKKELKAAVKGLWGNLIEKTTWPLTIIVPEYARGMELEGALSVNPNIRFAYYSNSNYQPWEKVDLELLDRNLVAPPSQTVVSLCTWFAIYQGYENTYLIGADTSFVADLKVDQQTNIVYTIDQHFYNNQEVYKDTGLFDANHCKKYGMKMSAIFEDVGGMFKDYDLLARYAAWKGVGLYNASEYSWIDALERKKIE